MLRFSSCQAEIADEFCKRLAEFIGEKLSIPTEFIGDIPWQERERLLDRGEIQVCWICGLPYVRKKYDTEHGVRLLAASVMRHPRYGAQPVYYSDVIVRADSCILSKTCAAKAGHRTKLDRIPVTTWSAIIWRRQDSAPITSAALWNPVLTKVRFECSWIRESMRPRSTALFWKWNSPRIPRLPEASERSRSSDLRPRLRDVQTNAIHAYIHSGYGVTADPKPFVLGFKQAVFPFSFREKPHSCFGMPAKEIRLTLESP